ncbi:MAG: hypothetical protein KDB07_09850, partial [Planctomycetes bacterium]|nr:hypothetical protein [Planctomycetota bacterium]
MKKIKKHVKVYALLGTFAVLASACCSTESAKHETKAPQNETPIGTSAPAESAPEVQDGKDVEAPFEIGDKRRTLPDILRDLSVPSTDILHSDWIPYLEKSIEIGKPALREHLRVLTMISAYDEGW